MIKNIKKNFNFLKTKLLKREKEGKIVKQKKSKGKVAVNSSKFMPLVLCGTLILTGCSTLAKNTNRGNNNTTTSSSNEYHDSYWDTNKDMFTYQDTAEEYGNENDNVNDVFSYKSTQDTIDVYYFDNFETQRIESTPVGIMKKDAHDTFEKFESYNLAYRGIEEMDDSFEGKYTFTEEDSYRLISEDFNIVDAISKANSSKQNEKEDAELLLSMAKKYYQNWLDYNADAVLEYEENNLKSTYKAGEKLNLSYFDNYEDGTIQTTPVGTIEKDAYETFEKFESYNLAYRAIEEMDDDYQNKYTFTKEEKYKLISEGFNIDEIIQKTLSSNPEEAENAKKVLVMAKEYYKTWLDYNDDTVIEYLEAKIK